MTLRTLIFFCQEILQINYNFKRIISNNSFENDRTHVVLEFFSFLQMDFSSFFPEKMNLLQLWFSVKIFCRGYVVCLKYKLTKTVSILLFIFKTLAKTKISFTAVVRLCVPRAVSWHLLCRIVCFLMCFRSFSGRVETKNTDLDCGFPCIDVVINPATYLNYCIQTHP